MAAAEYYLRIFLDELKHLPSGPDKRILFDHIPKTAGTSVNKVLRSNYSLRRTFYAIARSRSEYLEMTDRERLRFHLITGHDSRQLIQSLPCEFITTTVLREPVTRITSLWHYLKRSTYHNLNKIIHEQNYSLAGFLGSGLTGEMCNYMTFHFTQLAREEIISNPNQASDLAVRNANQYNLIGLMEDLPSYLKQLSKLSGINIPKTSPVANKTAPGEKQHISDMEIEMVKEYNEADILFFEKMKKKIVLGE